jgi:hypothetical protein
MSHLYTVGDRKARPCTTWGFGLPPMNSPEALPPIYLPTAGNTLAEAMMDEIIVGYGSATTVMDIIQAKSGSYRKHALQESAHGIWTAGISDCMVVCAAYYDPSKSAWGRFWFQHVQGGLYEKVLEDIRWDLVEDDDNSYPHRAHRHAVIAAGNYSGTSEIASALDSAGVPLNNINIYISGTGNRGFAFGIDFSTGLFGETTGQGAVLLPNDDW